MARSKYKDDNPCYGRIRYRMHREKRDTFIGSIGDYGSGKTNVGMRFCYDLDWKKLWIKRGGDMTAEEILIQRMIYEPDLLLDLIASEKLKAYSGIVFEEPLVSVGKRDWYTEANKALTQAFEVVRRWHYLIVWPMQTVEKLDSNLRTGRMNYLIECLKIDFVNKYNVVKIKEVQYNPILNKDYPKYLRDGKGIRNPCYIPQVPKEFVDAYEKMARLAKLKILKNSSARLKRIKLEEKEQKEKKASYKDEGKIVEEILASIKVGNSPYIKPNGDINIAAISGDYNIRDHHKYYRIKNKVLLELQKIEQE